MSFILCNVLFSIYVTISLEQLGKYVLRIKVDRTQNMQLPIYFRPLPLFILTQKELFEVLFRGSSFRPLTQFVLVSPGHLYTIARLLLISWLCLSHQLSFSFLFPNQLLGIKNAVLLTMSFSSKMTENIINHDVSYKQFDIEYLPNCGD